MKNDINIKEEKIKDKLSKIASKIKKDKLNIVHPNYNIKNLKQDIESKNFKELDEETIKKYEKIINSEVKKASKINIEKIDLQDLLNKTNIILQKEVKEKKAIARFENKDKIEFAMKGKDIHKKGDVCAFCGNKISDDVFEELIVYFSVDEVSELENNIKTIKKLHKELEEKVENININEYEFYEKYKKEMKNLNIDGLKVKYLEFLFEIKKALDEKSIFTKLDKLNLELPKNIEELLQKYNELVNQNNNDDLVKQKEEAKEKLKNHYIAEELDKIDYSSQEAELNRLKKEKEDFKKNKFDKQNEVIEEINKKIKFIDTKINELQKQTKNEKILAQNINKKLEKYVSFELVHCENTNQKGEYKIKCTRTDKETKERDITQLSTGEKNIIAFLYFIEKLNEIEENGNNKEKVVIFDDPMNSNDDTMQYLIIKELQKLFDEPFKTIILTHNKHFYMNVTYSKKCYTRNNFYRLYSTDVETEIIKINDRNEDFKTSYQELWQQLKILENNDSVSEFVILNLIRRIIETYTKFNNIKENDFYEDMEDARKLFNVNSHSIDDFEAELNGKTKKEIIQLLKECFEKNNAINHFEKFYGKEQEIEK